MCCRVFVVCCRVLIMCCRVLILCCRVLILCCRVLILCCRVLPCVRRVLPCVNHVLPCVAVCSCPDAVGGASSTPRGANGLLCGAKHENNAGKKEGHCGHEPVKGWRGLNCWALVVGREGQNHHMLMILKSNHLNKGDLKSKSHWKSNYFKIILKYSLHSSNFDVFWLLTALAIIYQMKQAISTE